MNCTQKLYDISPYATEFRAEVLSCTAVDGSFAVVLDKTLFFPEEGGQSCDVGTLSSAAVRHVSIADGVITHICSQALSGEVGGKIDFARRFRNMQSHSAEHIVSGLIHSRFSYQNVGFHLGADVVTMDYDGYLDENDLRTVETEANRIVYGNKPITAYYPSREELSRLDYRSKKPIDGDVRIVSIPDCDICACCAPHVASTGEIGSIKLLYAERYKGGCRVYMLAGSDAARDYAAKNDILYRLGARLSVPPEQVCDAVERTRSENESLRIEKALLTRNLCAALAAGVPLDAPFYLRLFAADEFPSASLKQLAEAIRARCPDGALFVSLADDTEPNRYQFLLFSSDKRFADVFASFKSTFTVKGGGRPPYYQGTVIAERAQIEAFFERFFTA